MGMGEATVTDGIDVSATESEDMEVKQGSEEELSNGGWRGTTEEEFRNMQEWEEKMSLLAGERMQALNNMGPLRLTIYNSLVTLEREREYI